MVDLPGFDKQQLKKAVRSLLKYVGEQQDLGPAQLIEEDEILHLVVALKKAPVGPRKDKPVRLPIPHPLFSADGAEICLFVKDHKGEGHKAAKARLAKLQKNGGVAKVRGVLRQAVEAWGVSAGTATGNSTHQGGQLLTLCFTWWPPISNKHHVISTMTQHSKRPKAQPVAKVFPS